MNGLNELAAEVYHNNVAKGFYEKPKNIGEMIALMHSELSEMLEADRKDRYSRMTQDRWSLLNSSPDDEAYKECFEAIIKDTFEDELADTFIRVLDMAGFMDIDLHRHVEAKMRYNALRQKYHGKKY